MSLKLGKVTTSVMSSAEAAKRNLDATERFRSKKVRELYSDIHHNNLKGEPVNIGSFQDDNKLDVNTIYSEDFIQSVEKDREMKELVTNIMKENLDATERFRSKKVRELYSDIHHNNLKGEPVNIGSFQDDNKLDVNTIYSEDFIQSVEKDREMKELVTNIMKEVGRPNLVDCFPVLKIINPHGIKRRT
ncbi:Cytochrome P450 [Vigna unguiculata]|uniref:Cytochrome P450 n=1 Tax=Vigna unguiculata TaxID=3917 RepID=A0A4D6LDY0_VIGUN|nr:Cytochrome P450 [Vigna unguiculata]